MWTYIARWHLQEASNVLCASGVRTKQVCETMMALGCCVTVSKYRCSVGHFVQLGKACWHLSTEWYLAKSRTNDCRWRHIITEHWERWSRQLSMRADAYHRIPALACVRAVDIGLYTWVFSARQTHSCMRFDKHLHNSNITRKPWSRRNIVIYLLRSVIDYRCTLAHRKCVE